MKTIRACTGMLTSENDDFEFLKPVKNIKSTCTTVSGLMELFSLSAVPYSMEIHFFHIRLPPLIVSILLHKCVTGNGSYANGVPAYCYMGKYIKEFKVTSNGKRRLLRVGG